MLLLEIYGIDRFDYKFVNYQSIQKLKFMSGDEFNYTSFNNQLHLWVGEKIALQGIEDRTS